MSRQLCGICMCPYDEQDGSCGCTEVNQECNSMDMNKPVGRYYWESVVDGHFMAIPSEGTIHYEIDDFPLYLHPVKELTDEEIEQLANENLGDSFDCDIMWMRMFVKAILRKAQEQ